MIFLLASLWMSVTTLAKDLGQTGPSYAIAEADLLQLIQEKLQQLQESGTLETTQKTMTKNMLHTVNEPAPVNGLDTVTHRRTWLFDPSITLRQTVYAPNGTVIANAGQVINPLDTVSMTTPLLFFDARSNAQRQWALKRFHALHEKAMLILTGGRVLDLMKQWQVPLYFDQGGQLTTRFHITAVPLMMTQQGHQLLMTEEPAR